MGRPVVLSNGQLFVGLDEHGLVHDFYYPYVGLENLTNARSLHHKIGVWVDGRFSWTDDGSWHIAVTYETNALISSIDLQNDSLKLHLHLTDFIDTEYNALIRRVGVTNQNEAERDIRLFMHQVFQISRAGRADTALYAPDDNYILDYKGRYSLLIAGKFADGGDFDQFAVGSYGIEGKSGTFRDAEDGELSGNTVEHGGVDSVLRFRRLTGAGATFDVDYWIAAGDSQADAQQIHTHLKHHPIDDRLAMARGYWRTWLGQSNKKLAQIPDSYSSEVRTSMLVIKAHCDERGSILASGDSTIFNFGRDYYCYCWPRDAAYALLPLIRLGQYDEAKRFFDFARDTLHRDGYLMHKYQPDKTIGSTWHPLVRDGRKELAIQEDETAMVLYVLGQYWNASRDRTTVENYYTTLVEPAATFMVGFVDDATGLPHASYDLWEQNFLTSTYSVGCVIGGLEAAAEMAEAFDRTEDALCWRKAAGRMRQNLDTLFHPDGYFRKGFLLGPNGELRFDDTLDASNLYGPYLFAGLSMDDPRMQSTLKHIEERLFNTSPIGGVIRYEHDGYFLAKQQYKGNPWIVCTMWLARCYLAADQPDKTRELVRWAIARAGQSGSLSEQFDPETGFAVGATPLVWSHAEFINTVLDLVGQNTDTVE